MPPERARPVPPAPYGAALSRLAGILPIAAVLVPLSILTVVGWLNWRGVWHDAEVQMLRAAGSAAEYGKRTFESYGLAAGRVNDRLRGLSDADISADEAALQQVLQRISTELTQSEQAYVIDREGQPLLATNGMPVPRAMRLSDRDDFQALSAPSPPGLFVSRSFICPFDGRLLFAVSRLRRETGNAPQPTGFDGIVAIAGSPHVLADGMRPFLHVPTDRMAFVRADGYGLSTTSGLSDLARPLPKVDASSPFYAFADRKAVSAVYLSDTAMPGAKSLLAMRLIDGFPIYAVSVRPGADIVAQWWRVMTPLLSFGALATLSLLVLSLRVWGDQRRLATINAELRRDNDLSADRLGRTKRFGLVGTFEADPRTGIGRRSPEYMGVQGLPLAAAEETHADWTQRLHPDDKARAQRELQAALADPLVTDYAQTYRILTPAGDVRWIAAQGEITRDAAGRATMLRGAHVDITPLRTTQMALAESDARLRLAQESVGIGAWEWIGTTRTLTASRPMLELCGFDPEAGAPGLKALLARVHPDDRGGLHDLLRKSRRTRGFSSEFRILRPGASGGSETIWLAVRAKLVALPGSPKSSLMGIAYDVTERKRAEELTTLMAHEVEHRAKNALAVVSSLLRMTKAKTAEELARIMDGRVMALSQTMALLGRGGWTGADLREIVVNELKPFGSQAPDEPGSAGGSPAIEIAGPPVTIAVDAAQPLSMALHELATNAAKYGALSVQHGRLGVEWRIAGERVHLRWCEEGGPPLTVPPPRSGFGSRLITMLFEGQMGGVVERRWEPTGLVCEMSFPMRRPDAPSEMTSMTTP